MARRSNRIGSLRGSAAACAALLLCAATARESFGQSQPRVDSGTAPQAAPNRDPQLKLRPPPGPVEAKEPVGRMRLDLVVTDASGAPVAGLSAQDFQLLDDEHPQKLVSFHAVDGAPGAPSSRVSVLLVIDTVNSGLSDVSAMRQNAEVFLRQNGGKLAQPVTVLLLTDAGFEVVGHTSLEGNSLAQAVHAIHPMLHTIHSAAGGEALLERFQLSGKALGAITAHEVAIPGRKLMIWMGPGWPLLPREEVTYDARSHALNFQALAELTNQLREARIVICSAGGGTEFFVHDYLKPVKSERDVNSANLALQVLAVHSGGLTLDAGNRSATKELLDACMREAGPSYAVSFDPPQPDKAMEYHALRVTVDKPGLAVHTSAGYYAEP